MIISVTSLVKEYKSKVPTTFLKDLFYPDFKMVKAVSGISFSVEKGESVALLGPNGAGKTTTMKMLSGLIYPTSGTVDVLGFFPFDRKKEYLRRIGLVMGNKTGLDWDLTPQQSFDLIKKIYKLSDQKYKQRLSLLTEMLDLKEYLTTQVRKLSLGERMKMELVGAILHDPEILFLDEPTIGLDVLSKQKIRDFLREIQKTFGVTLLLTSHDMTDVEKVCDRVIVVNKGVKVFDDSLEKLTARYNKERYVKFIFNEKPKVSQMPEIGTITEKGDSYYVYKIQHNELKALISKATDEESLIDIEINSVPLDEIIADIYQHSGDKK